MVYAARYWHPLADGRIQCDLCPRACRLNDGQRAFCFVRERQGDQLVLSTYGRSTGFCLDPIEKKPLAHFLPGTAVLSFGTAGCNLGCKFCQNWDISKSRQVEKLSEIATPQAIAEAAVSSGARSVAFTYNDPVIWAEYAIDVATACRERGIATVAVTAGYVAGAGRRDLFAVMDAANVDLKGFTDEFYHELCAGHLEPVLDTLVWIKRETSVWLEVTTLLIPGKNDSSAELERLVSWFAANLGCDVPRHFTAFHPDWRLQDIDATPAATLARARAIARAAGLRYVYIGNVRDREGATTRCPSCHAALIVRDGYRIVDWRLAGGACASCGAIVPGRFEARPGAWGERRVPVHIAATPHRFEP